MDVRMSAQFLLDFELFWLNSYHTHNRIISMLRFGRNRQTMFAAFLGILVELPGRTSRINPPRLALCVAKGVQSCKLGICLAFTNDQLQFSGFAGNKCVNDPKWISYIWRGEVSQTKQWAHMNAQSLPLEVYLQFWQRHLNNFQGLCFQKVLKWTFKESVGAGCCFAILCT